MKINICAAKINLCVFTCMSHIYDHLQPINCGYSECMDTKNYGVCHAAECFSTFRPNQSDDTAAAILCYLSIDLPEI